jgi:hypothetical protein
MAAAETAHKRPTHRTKDEALREAGGTDDTTP